MNNFWFIIYNILIIPPLYISLIILSLFNSKIKSSLREREKLFTLLQDDLQKINKSKRNIWFHSSSVGEFEQAKPIIEKLKKNNKFNIIISFLSPSGYHSAKRYEFADVITYYPFDSIGKTKRFFNLINPSAAIIMRYDIWPNSIFELSKRKIRIFLVDATMKSTSPRKLFVVKNFHNVLFSNFTKILTVSGADRERFLDLNLDDAKVETVGDTRYDRVYVKSQTALQKKILPKKIFSNKKIFVAGSTWHEDEEILFPALLKLYEHADDLISIIVPHEPTIPTIEQIEFEFKDKINTIRFSSLNQYDEEKIIIIDSIGILLTLYAYADVAFVGGGFKYNIHNILEPAVYGIPVIFGPKHQNSQEAELLIKKGGGFEVQDKKQIYRLLKKFFTNNEFRIGSGTASKNFVFSNIGATDKIISHLNQFIQF